MRLPGLQLTARLATLNTVELTYDTQSCPFLFHQHRNTGKNRLHETGSPASAFSTGVSRLFPFHRDVRTCSNISLAPRTCQACHVQARPPQRGVPSKNLISSSCPQPCAHKTNRKTLRWHALNTQQKPETTRGRRTTLLDVARRSHTKNIKCITPEETCHVGAQEPCPCTKLSGTCHLELFGEKQRYTFAGQTKAELQSGVHAVQSRKSRLREPDDICRLLDVSL